MISELFIAQLDWSVTEDELYDLFSQYGEVSNARIPTDKITGKKRGFAFVAMATPDQAQIAINALNNRELKGRNLVVKFAEPKPAYSGHGAGNRAVGYGNRSGGSRGNYGNTRY